MNLEEVKRVGPSYPWDIHWTYYAYCKYLDKHPEYEIGEGDILIFVVGRFPDDLSAIPLEFIHHMEAHVWKEWGFKPRDLPKPDSRSKVPYHALSHYRFF